MRTCLVVLAVLLTGCVVLAGGVPDMAGLPWVDTASLAKDALQGGPGYCGDAPIMAIGAVFEDEEYTFWLSETRFVAALFNGSVPVSVWFGSIDKDGKFKDVRREAFNPEVHRTPCDYLVQRAASAPVETWWGFRASRGFQTLGVGG